MSSGMSDPQLSNPKRAWYRSLYWRIGLGLVAFLAIMLGGQGLLFLVLTNRMAGSMPAREPRQFAALVASDISAALTRDAATDVAAYVHEHYDPVLQPVIVGLRDGRVVATHDAFVP